MSQRDTAIGQAVATLRKDRSQQALADLMRDRGWKWSQATVWSVEKGERPLRLTEAADLAAVLKIEMSLLLGPPVASVVSGLVDARDEAYRAIVAETVSYLRARGELDRLTESGELAEVEDFWLKFSAEDADMWEARSPEQAVEDARFDFASKQGDDHG